MKIVEVNCIADEIGLGAIQLLKLERVVLIVGKNGSGKTRLLNKIKACIDNYPNATTDKNLKTEIAEWEKSIPIGEKQLYDMANEGYDEGDQHFLAVKNTVNAQKQQLELLKSKFKDIILDSPKPPVPFIDFVPTKLRLDLPQSQTKKSIQEAFNQTHYVHYNKPEPARKSSSDVLLYIQELNDKYFEATHPNSTVADQYKKEIEQSYQSFKSLIKKILGTDIERSNDTSGDFLLFGRKPETLNLSAGQTILLQLCVNIHAKEARLNNLILFLDEPENHLHPAVLIEVVDRIIEIVPNGQIWIATHSINLIAHLDKTSLFYIDEGKIEYAGNAPEKVLEGLLGDDEERLRLSDFITMPYKYAELKFAYECLLKAPAIMTGQTDLQTQQVRENLEKLISTGNQVRILDFGAGRGRLIANILAYENDKGKNIQWLDYIAFEPTGDYTQECRQHIQVAYDSAEKRHFTNLPDLKSQLVKESFDIIVMLNVFHEIDPSYWVRLFEKDGELYQLLKPDGYLLIVEHQILTYGETAHSKGFLMFDQLEFKTLFSISERDMADKKYFVDSKRDGELKAHFIQKDLLANISITSKENALKSLKDHSIDEITRLKTQEPSLKNGRHLAFWNQQLANAFMALRGS